MRKISVILAGKTCCCRHFSTRLGKNAVMSKQVTNTVAVWTLFDQEKAQLLEKRITDKLTLLKNSKMNRPGYKLFKSFR